MEKPSLSNKDDAAAMSGPLWILGTDTMKTIAVPLWILGTDTMKTGELLSEPQPPQEPIQCRTPQSTHWYFFPE